MAEKKFWARFFETRYFGLVIGLLVFALMLALSHGTIIVGNIELKVLDLDFRMKNIVSARRVQEGVSVVQRNPKVSPNILIVGIDDKTFFRLVQNWPFPRHLYADLLNAFTRIKNQAERERAVLIDIFFADPDKTAVDDAQFISAIEENGRVFVETALNAEENTTVTEEDYYARQEALFSRFGRIDKMEGDWTKVTTTKGFLPPLKPYGEAARGFGHANFITDDDQTFRRLALIAKTEHVVKEIPLEELTVGEPIDRQGFERLAWIDKENGIHEVPYPLTPTVISDLRRRMEKNAPPKAEDTNNDNNPDRYYFVVRKYKDSFIPSINLVLALEYFNKKLSDIEISLGKYIRIPSPEQFNVETQTWEPLMHVVTPAEYDSEGNLVKEGTFRKVPEILIPIDERGAMLINFIGGPSSANPDEPQTFPVRSFAGYSTSAPSSDPAKWPATKKLANSIIMVGAFSQGVAADQKPTPFGLMYGVEIHANALNTILMANFIHVAKPWVTDLILFAMIMLIAFMVSRLSTIGSLITTILAMIVYFFIVLLVFELNGYVLTLTSPVVGSFLCFLSVVAFRTMTEERDKRRIRDMFGKYVSPSVVEEILQNPPELGGLDKELTVFFSDIRGFTTLSETMTPQELVNHLNAYLTAMTDIILDCQGTLDKYVGDAIMCFWGAPLPQPDHALLACKCALRQVEVLKKLNAGWPAEKQIAIGIGMNSGTMTVGNMGSLGRMNYTLTGDNVNLGARLEGTNKEYYTTIIMSENTYEHVKDKVIARELDNIRVKGKNKPVLIYELVDIKDGLEPPTPVTVKKGNR